MVELPTWRGTSDSASRALAIVDTWALSPALTELATAFGAHPPRSTDASDRLDWFEGFAAEHWDFRAGRERNLADDAALTDTQRSLVLDLAPELGLSGQESPSRLHYDTVVMTGGMVRAGLVKPRHVATLRAHGLATQRVVFLGAFRPFAGDEIAAARALGVTGDDEFSAMIEGVQRAFGPLGDATVQAHEGVTRADSWAVWTWRVQGLEVQVIAAAASAGRQRADTADTFRFWAALSHPQSALVVTTPIYVPYQAAVAAEVLGLERGFSVETVATSAAANDLGEWTQRFAPEHHLQELGSAIRAMRSLRARLVESVAAGQ